MAKIGGWALDVDTQRLTWSDEVYRIHEVDVAFEPTVENAIGFYAPEQRQVMASAVQNGTTTGAPWDLTLPLITATGRRIWNASSIYSPTLVIAGEYDTWSFPEDREGLMRDLSNAPKKKSVLIKDATHFVLFEKNRVPFFEAIEAFLKE